MPISVQRDTVQLERETEKSSELSFVWFHNYCHKILNKIWLEMFSRKMADVCQHSLSYFGTLRSLHDAFDWRPIESCQRTIYLLAEDVNTKCLSTHSSPSFSLISQ